MLIDKEYYRLSELEKNHSVSLEDIRYAFEKKQVLPVLFVERTKIIIGRFLDYKGSFRGFASVYYRGLAELSREKIFELFDLESVREKTFKIVENENIDLHSYAYPFSIPFPNNYITEWESGMLDYIDWKNFIALAHPSEQNDVAKMFKEGFENFINGESKAIPIEEYSQYKGTIPKTLTVSPIEHKLNDLCLLHEDLMKIKAGLPDIETRLYEEQLLPKFSTEPELPKEKQTREHQFKDLLVRILEKNPGISGKRAWRLIQDEVKLEVMDRTLDVDGILLDVSTTEVLWKSRYGKTRNVKQTSFDAALSRARKLVPQN